MCCTGACLYEDYTGECTIGNGYFPDDAWCQLPSEETEYEEKEDVVLNYSARSAACGSLTSDI